MVPLSRRLVRRQNSVLMLLVQELTKNPQAASVTPVSKTVGLGYRFVVVMAQGNV